MTITVMVLQVEGPEGNEIGVTYASPSFWGCTLPETNSSHLNLDGWNAIVSFWDGLFSWAFAVCFKEGRFGEGKNKWESSPHPAGIAVGETLFMAVVIPRIWVKKNSCQTNAREHAIPGSLLLPYWSGIYIYIYIYSTHIHYILYMYIYI